MARTVRDARLETRTARGSLKARPKPYYRALEPGLHLGYRKPLAGAGKWVGRHYIGEQRYQVEVIGTADDYSDADGVAVLSYGQAQTKARERMVARAHHAAGRHGQLIVRDAVEEEHGPLTVRKAVEAYLAHLDTHKKSGYHARCSAEALIMPQLGDIEVQALSTDQIRKWQSALAKAPARVRTGEGGKQQYRKHDNSDDGVRRRKASANRVFTTLRAALNLAWHEGQVPSDGAWRRVKPFKGVTAARARFLTLAECQRLINASQGNFRALVEAALLTGARFGELSRLEVRDFNADSGTLTIRISKTDDSRHVVLTKEGVSRLRQWCLGRPGKDLLFTRDDGQQWQIPNQDRRIRLACKRARIIPAISFHCLRHTYASLSIMNGVPLMVVAKNLGHRDTRMCELHYGHLAPSYVADEIRKGAPRFGLKPSKKVIPIA